MPIAVSSSLPRRGSRLLLTAAGLLCVAAAHAATGTDFDAERKRCEAEPSASVRVVCLRDLKAAMAGQGGAAASAPAKRSNAASGPSAAASAASGSDNGKLYTVVDGNKVDPGTLKGFQTWRAAACDRCHGANQQGLVGPSLIDSLKTLSKQDFVTTVTNGRVEKGMPSWKSSKVVMDNIDHLYAYLKGRSDGAIKTSHVYPIK